jgi:hypothetical protein
MRFVAGCLIIATGGVVLAQSSRELHRRYGEPDMERFNVQPGVSLTVEYGSDHLACKFSIAPTKPFDPSDPVGIFSTISSDSVTEILDEIVPVSTRGKETGRATTASSCANEVESFEYDSAVIVRSVIGCASSKPQQENHATVWLKRDICPKPKLPWAAPRR